MAYPVQPFYIRESTTLYVRMAWMHNICNT